MGMEVAVAPHVYRITSHSNLSEIVKSFETTSPILKDPPPPKEMSTIRLNYYKNRMKTFAKSAQSSHPSLIEVKTGKNPKKRIEKEILALYTYFVGLGFLLFLLK